MDKLDDSMEVTEQENIANDILSLEKSQLSTSFQGKYPKQAYRKAWEDLPDFKGIILLYTLSRSRFSVNFLALPRLLIQLQLLSFPSS